MMDEIGESAGEVDRSVHGGEVEDVEVTKRKGERKEENEGCGGGEQLPQPFTIKEEDEPMVTIEEIVGVIVCVEVEEVTF